MSYKKNTAIILILSLFAISNIIFLNFYSDVWWDSSVYIGMGKYIYSLGKSGLWEPSRPLVFPLILGLGWKLNIDAVYFARAVSVIFAVLAVFMTYKIGIRLFSKKTALLAAFFLAFSYNFLFFAPNMLTEIPSTFFALAAFYFFLENRFFLAGLFSGIAVMTRLFQAFALVGIGISFLFYFYKKPDFAKKVVYILSGFFVVVLPYFLLNHYMYSNILFPLTEQLRLVNTTGWIYYKGFEFYFIGLLKENFLIATILLIPFFYKRDWKFSALIMAPLVYLAIFSFIRHKEMRLLLVIFPYLYILASYCTLEIYKRVSSKRMAFGMFFILVILWMGMTLAALKQMLPSHHQKNNIGFSHFQLYLRNNHGNVMVTNPLYALYSDAKINNILYYFQQNLVTILNTDKDDINSVLYNECDIPCPPAEIDPLCPESRKSISNALSKFKIVYEKDADSCKYRIFER